jgi:hydroxyacylglutathione hydrolase
VEVAAKHSVMEVIFVAFHTSPLVWVGDFMLRKDPRNTEAPHINI